MRNLRITEEARTLAVSALERFNQGELIPAYQAMYDQYYKDLLRRTEEEAYRRGFLPGSTEYNRMMENTLRTAQAYKGQLLQKQLVDALSASGLSEMTISQILTKWQVQAKVFQPQMLGAIETLRTQALLSAPKIAAGLGAMVEGLRTLEQMKRPPVATAPTTAPTTPTPSPPAEKTAFIPLMPETRSPLETLYEIT